MHGNDRRQSGTWRTRRRFDPDDQFERGFVGIKEALSRFMGRFGLTEQAGLTRLWQNWAQAVGEDLASVAHPLGHKGRTLIVGADEPIILNEITYIGPELMARANAFLGEERFDKVLGELIGDRVPLDAIAAGTKAPGHTQGG